MQVAAWGPRAAVQARRKGDGFAWLSGRGWPPPHGSRRSPTPVTLSAGACDYIPDGRDKVAFRPARWHWAEELTKQRGFWKETLSGRGGGGVVGTGLRGRRRGPGRAYRQIPQEEPRRDPGGQAFPGAEPTAWEAIVRATQPLLPQSPKPAPARGPSVRNAGTPGPATPVT